LLNLEFVFKSENSHWVSCKFFVSTIVSDNFGIEYLG
jgi:hypothetical protein